MQLNKPHSQIHHRFWWTSIEQRSFVILFPSHIVCDKSLGLRAHKYHDSQLGNTLFFLFWCDSWLVQVCPLGAVIIAGISNDHKKWKPKTSLHPIQWRFAIWQETWPHFRYISTKDNAVSNKQQSITQRSPMGSLCSASLCKYICLLPTCSQAGFN